MKVKTLTIYTPIILFIGMLLDGQLSSTMESLTKGRYFTFSGLLLLMFLLAAKRLSQRYLLIVALVLGFLSDVYFTGVIGINTFLYPLLVYWMVRFKKIMNRNILTQLESFIILFTVYQVASILLQALFQLVSVHPILFVVSVLGPSILFNLVLFILLIYPLRWLFRVKVN